MPNIRDMNKSTILILLLLISMCCKVYAQNNRINTSNNIAWFSFQATTSLKKQWSLQTEYHCRRVGGIEEWQQSLLRLGINYRLSSQTSLRVGYALVENYAYGEYSINVFGKNFAEHRMYEALLHNHSEGKFSFNNRLMLEQRFVGKYSNAIVAKEDSYVYANRLRMMTRIQYPLKGNTIKDKTPYISVYDELFIGFGKNVNNVFDQNRLGVLLGYKVNKHTQIEMGYIHQQLQFNRTINNWNVFQDNSGFISSINFNL